MAMPSFLKRYRMELDLRFRPLAPELPAGFGWLAWSPNLLDTHADVKFQSFRDQIDTYVFPNLGSPEGCQELMHCIAERDTFVPQATWLLVGPFGPCGTVQGLRDRSYGAVQNLGVTPDFRGRGLGAVLLLKALEGFSRVGLRKAYLEVTVRNESAMRTYRRLGFRSTRTIYKQVYTIPSEECVMI